MRREGCEREGDEVHDVGNWVKVVVVDVEEDTEGDVDEDRYGRTEPVTRWLCIRGGILRECQVLTINTNPMPFSTDR